MGLPSWAIPAAGGVAAAVWLAWLALRRAPRGWAPAALAALVGAALAAQAGYLAWRLGATPPSGAVPLALWGLATAAEAAGAVQAAVFALTAWALLRRPGRPRPPDPPEWPTVDVWITVVDEPIPVLARTVVAARGLDYPPDRLTVTVLDDGDRPEVAALCAEVGARRLVRPDRPRAAKAGNLNWGLAHTDAELVVTLDADMTPKPQFLRETAPYFRDPMVAFVQTPQTFANPDRFQAALGWRHGHGEQSFFMRELQSAKQAWDAVMYVGSNAVFRAAALRAIGGFCEGVITEDVPTGMLLQARGWRGVFVDRVLAMGLAPETVPDLLRQRSRWCQGNIQAARRWNPLTWPGLTWRQRVQYATGILYWWQGLATLVLLAAPLWRLDAGVVWLRAPAAAWAALWGAQAAALGALFDAISNGRTTLWRQRVIEAALAPALAWAAVAAALGRRPLRFHVTPKGVGAQARPRFWWRWAWPHLALLAAMLWGCRWLLHPAAALGDGGLAVSLAWNLANLATVAAALPLFRDRPDARMAPRAAVDEPVEVPADGAWIPARLADLSETGAQVVVEAPGVAAWPPEIAVRWRGWEVPAAVRWSRRGEGGRWRLGVQFHVADPTLRAELVRAAYGALMPVSEGPVALRRPWGARGTRSAARIGGARRTEAPAHGTAPHR